MMSMFSRNNMNCYNDFDFKRANIKVKLKNNDTLYYVCDFKHNATTCNIYLTTEVDKAYDFPVIKLSEYGVAKGDGFYSCKDFLIINENVDEVDYIGMEFYSFLEELYNNQNSTSETNLL